MNEMQYIIFDGHCSVCTQLAEAIQSSSTKDLIILSIHDHEARVLLGQVFPKGWKHAPYLVKVNQSGVHASTGIVGAYKLARLLGIRHAWRIWRQAHRQRTLRPFTTKANSVLIPRRQFIKMGLATGLATLFTGRTASIANACIICETCSMTCYQMPCGGYVSCPPPPPNSRRVCDRYDCYDNATGQFCGSFLANCSACGSFCA